MQFIINTNMCFHKSLGKELSLSSQLTEKEVLFHDLSLC